MKCGTLNISTAGLCKSCGTKLSFHGSEAPTTPPRPKGEAPTTPPRAAAKSAPPRPLPRTPQGKIIADTSTTPTITATTSNSSKDDSTIDPALSSLVTSLTELQREDGSWTFNENLANVLGVPNYSEIITTQTDLNLLGTSLVISYMNYFNQIEQARMIIEKANNWLRETQRRSVLLPQVTPSSSTTVTTPTTSNEEEQTVEIHITSIEQVGKELLYRIDVRMQNYQWSIYRSLQQFRELDANMKRSQLLSDDRDGVISLPTEHTEDTLQTLERYLRMVLSSKVLDSGSKDVDVFLTPRCVGDIDYEGKEVTLESVMDEKWSAMTDKLRAALTGGSTDSNLRADDQSTRGPEEGNKRDSHKYSRRMSFWDIFFQSQPVEEPVTYEPSKIELSMVPQFRISLTDDRTRVAWEIYTTELTYTRSLEIILKLFVWPLRAQDSPFFGTFSDEELKIM